VGPLWGTVVRNKPVPKKNLVEVSQPALLFKGMKTATSLFILLLS